MAAHPIAHIEFSATDSKAGAEFYSKLFGWQTQMADNNYWMFSAEGGPGGGFNTVGSSLGGGDIKVKPGEVIIYVSTADINATLARVEELGGRTLLGKTEIGEFGSFAIFADPTGNQVGLYTSSAQTS